MDKSSFEAQQRLRILERINRYNNVNTVKDQLDSIGDLSPYQRYKITVVTGYLQQALDRMNAGSYGVCVVCGCDIPRQRLILVPAALACVACDGKRQT
jgi:RNA polymerase-binding transcription factor DksA